MSLTVVSLPDDVSHCYNEVSCQLQTSLPLVTDNLKIACALFVELVYGSGTYTIVHTQWLDPNVDGIATFFWQTWLADCFEKLHFMPSTLSTTPSLQTQIVKRYKFLAAEHSGTPRTVTDDILTGPLTDARFVHRGGISKQAFQLRPYFGPSGWAMEILGDPLPFPFPSLPLCPPFMDYKGKQTTTSRGIDESLYFHFEGLAGAVTVTADIKVEYTLQDLTTASFTFATIATVNQYDVWYIPAGFEQLGLVAIQTLAGQNILNYTIWLEGMVGIFLLPLTEKKTFTVINSSWDIGNFVEVMYENSLGVFSHLLLLGDRIAAPEISQVNSAAYHETGIPTYLANFKQMSIDVDDVVKHSTGFLTRSQKRQFQELIASRCVLIKTSSFGWSRVQILTKSLAFEKAKNLHRADISYRFDRKSYTPNITL